MADDSKKKRLGDYHVVPNGQAGWILHPNAGSDSQTFATRGEAISAARALLRNALAPIVRVCVHVPREGRGGNRGLTVVAESNKVNARHARTRYLVLSDRDQKEQDDFEADLEYLLNKNAELYRRLAL